jgi:hypothetical protein
MRDRVEASHRGHVVRSRERELGIEDRDSQCRGRIPARHLHVRGRVRDHGVALRLAAGAGGRRDANHRQQRRRGFTVAPVVADAAPVRQEKIDPLRAIERAAAAEADDRIHVQRVGEAPSCLDHEAVRVHAEFLVRRRLDLLRFEQAQDLGRVARLHHASVRDEERPLKPELPRELPDTEARTRAEDHSRALLKLEWHHRL